MMKHEFEKLVDETISEEQYKVVERVYAFHPSIPDVGGKQVIADLWNDAKHKHGKGIYGINHMLAVANEEAKPASPVYEKHETPFSYYYTESGYVKSEEPKTIEEVYQYVVKELQKYNEPGDKYSCGPIDEYFSISCKYEGITHWPLDYSWIAVFCVQGGSEGYYTHVEAIWADGNRRQLLFLGKTLREDRDHALEGVRLLSHILEV